MKINTDIKYTLDDLRILPKYSPVPSRADVDTSAILFTKSNVNFKLQLPMISSPMPTVTEHLMMAFMAKYGGLGILHRFKSIEWTEKEIYAAKAKYAELDQIKTPLFGAAIGVNGDYLERLKMIIDTNLVKVICIDIAHGHHALMEKAIKQVLNIIPNDVHLMAGNVATCDGAQFLFDLGIDSIRVGIGSGSACSTQIQTGCGAPLAYSIQEALKAKLKYTYMSPDNQSLINKKTIIADGGIKNSGDIVKSIALGSDFVMCGSLFAGTKASPGEIIKDSQGRWGKPYKGAASSESQKAAGKKKIRAEGVSSITPYTGRIESVLEELKDGIQSGCSYVGALNFQQLKENAEFIIVSEKAHYEGTPHILSRN